METKFIKNLIGILSMVFAVCVLIASGFLLFKVLPLYNTEFGAPKIPLEVTSSETTTRPRNVPTSAPSPSTRSLRQQIFDSHASFLPRDPTQATPKLNEPFNLTNVLIKSENALEDILDFGSQIRKKRDLGANQRTNDKGQKGLGLSRDLNLSHMMDMICLDEWARFIGLAIGGIVISLTQILTCMSHLWGVGKTHNPCNLPWSMVVLVGLTNMILDVILWVLTGLSLYSSHCTRGELMKERSLFSFFVGMDAATLFVSLFFTKMPRERNCHNKFYDDDEIEEGHFPVSQRLRLETTDN